MNRVGVFLVVVLLGITSSITGNPSERFDTQFTVSEFQGPTIDWLGSSTNESLVIAWDGVYNGQTEEVHRIQARVNDSDGVDSVIFRFMSVAESEWSNVTGVMTEGDALNGSYHANYTYAVWWDYVASRPMTEGSGGNFRVKIFANDTLGNWIETGNLTYSGGYFLVHPPIDSFIRSPLGLGVTGTTIAAIVVVLVIARKRLG
jgi:hypothetical protein